MTDLNTGRNTNSNIKKTHKTRTKRLSTHIDMTPMVDLAFLLLTFFILTSAFVRPGVLEIAMPVNGDPSGVENILTLVLDKSNKVYYYYKIFNPDSNTPFNVTDYSANGIRKTLIRYSNREYEKIKELEKKLNSDLSLTQSARKQKFDKASTEIMSEKGSLTVIVKTCEGASYAHVIDIMDELNITFNSKRAILDISAVEEQCLVRQISNP